jgi:hypothetical protein
MRSISHFMSDEGFHMPNLIRDEAGEERGSFLRLAFESSEMRQEKNAEAFFDLRLNHQR